MSSWSMGYTTDTSYEAKYFGMLNPYLLRLLFLSQGLAFPKLGAQTTACELGFGQGLSVVLHGAATKVQWYGNDFMPSQVLFANHLAKQGEVKVNLSDDAFDEFLKRDDLPMFDYICLHGIWSWISKSNQDVIVEFIKKKLKVGGVLYISYNVTAVNETIEPIRFLLKSYIDTKGSPNLTNVQNLPAAFNFVSELIKLKPQYIKHNPHASDLFQNKMYSRDHNYIAHEYLNNSWQLESFAKVAQKLESAKLSYVCQALPLENMDNLQFSPDEIALFKEQSDLGVQLQLKDYFRQASFRTDVYTKGIVKLSAKQQLEQLDDTYFILIHNLSSKEPKTVNCRVGNNTKVNLEAFRPILDLMSDYQVHSYKGLRQALCQESNPIMSTSELTDLIVYATAASILDVAINPQEIDEATIDSCRKLNLFLTEHNSQNSIEVLASPITGGGVFADNLTQKLLHAFMLNENLTKPQLIELMKESLKQNSDNQDINLDSQAITDTLDEFAQTFLKFNLPLFKSLKII